ncbi:uncharacterized protein LOC116953863 isoform X2 [Petromyzon marinus]|nr:maternal protein pumilio-like isoform X2 [Petromyzon marinus]XP_032830029.1 maternal protein pumilio-like isoform X2 [Petromyzon marinus]
MLGRGVKRKAPRDDEDEVDDEEEASRWCGLHAGLQAPAHPVSRQAMLDLSLRKLHTPLRRRSEPCLRRALLIANTLRHVHDEGRRDAAAAAAAPPSHVSRTPDGDDEKLESLSAAIAAVLKDLEFVEDAAGQPCDAAVLVPPPSLQHQLQQHQQQQRQHQQQRMDALFGVAAVAAAGGGGGGTATGFLTELALEDIFWEPDAIVDVWGLARGAAAVAAAAAASPFSVAALDDGGGSRPFAGGAATAAAAVPSPLSPQPCRVDATDIGDLSLEVMVRS